MKMHSENEVNITSQSNTPETFGGNSKRDKDDVNEVNVAELYRETHIHKKHENINRITTSYPIESFGHQSN